MSSLRGVASVGKRSRSAVITFAVSSTESVVCVTTASFAGSRTRELLGIGHGLDQVDVPADARVEAAHRALDLRMAGVADQDHVEPVARVLADFHVHLGHQRAGRVEHGEPAPRGLLLHAARHAVRAEDDGRAVRHGVELVHEHGAEAAQAVHHEPVVHDLVAHVDRRAEQLDRALDDVDRAVDAGAEAARIGEQDLHRPAALLRRLSSSASMISMIAPVVIADVRDVEGREVGFAPVEVQEVDDVAVDEAVVGVADRAAEDQREPDREPVWPRAGSERSHADDRDARSPPASARKNQRCQPPASARMPKAAPSLCRRVRSRNGPDRQDLVQLEVADDVPLRELVERDHDRRQPDPDERGLALR